MRAHHHSSGYAQRARLPTLQGHQTAQELDTLSYVGDPFRHDLFVSYSHGSDADGDPTLQGWSLAFVRELERELRADRAFRDTLSLFIDAQGAQGQRLDRMAPLTDQLDAHVGAAALLLVLMTPDYQASSWCRDERNWWAAKQADLAIDPAGRVAMVRAWPVPAEWPDGPWPAPLADRAGQPLVGYSFHAGEGRAARPLGWTEWQAGFSPKVREALLGLAGDLAQKLDTLRAECERRRVASASVQRLAKPAGQTLYLHGRADCARAWELAARELGDSGYAVFPGEPDPIEREPARLEQIRQRRVETLADCDALVLVGSPDGRAIDADLVVVGKHDRNSARSRSDRPLPCALLDTVGLPVATPVRKQTARILQADWLDATGGAVSPVVRQWLSEKSQQVASA